MQDFKTEEARSTRYTNQCPLGVQSLRHIPLAAPYSIGWNMAPPAECVVIYIYCIYRYTFLTVRIVPGQRWLRLVRTQPSHVPIISRIGLRDYSGIAIRESHGPSAYYSNLLRLYIYYNFKIF